VVSSFLLSPPFLMGVDMRESGFFLPPSRVLIRGCWLFFSDIEPLLIFEEVFFSCSPLRAHVTRPPMDPPSVGESLSFSFPSFEEKDTPALFFWYVCLSFLSFKTSRFLNCVDFPLGVFGLWVFFFFSPTAPESSPFKDGVRPFPFFFSFSRIELFFWMFCLPSSSVVFSDLVNTAGRASFFFLLSFFR